MFQDRALIFIPTILLLCVAIFSAVLPKIVMAAAPDSVTQQTTGDCSPTMYQSNGNVDINCHNQILFERASPREKLGLLNIEWSPKSFRRFLLDDDRPIIEYFLKSGMSPLAWNDDGHNPIIYDIAESGFGPDDDWIIDTFVKNGYDIDVKWKINGPSGYVWVQNPLVIALEAGNYRMVKILISHGASKPLAKNLIAAMGEHFGRTYLDGQKAIKYLSSRN